MISEQKKFLFIHVPKTGGNSIQNFLKEYSEDEILSPLEHQDGIERFSVKNKKYNISKHSFLSHCKSTMDPMTYNSLFKFSTIRNPWDRMVSLYFSPAQGRTEWDRDEFLVLIQGAVALRDFINENPSEEYELDNVINRRLDRDIDYLVRFENLNDDFKIVCEKLDIPYSFLAKNNISDHSHYSEYYDDETRELVKQRFQDEIIFGAYEFDSA